MTGPAAGAIRDDHRFFLRCRRHVLGAAGATVGAMALLAVLLLAPNRLASLRLGELGLAWWVAGALVLGLLGVVRQTLRRIAGASARTGASRATALALAAVWGSPALWFGLLPLLLSDGTRGLWLPVVAVGGTALALILLGAAARSAMGTTASGLVSARWPGARGCRVVLASAEAVVAVLFVGAQVAAAREIGAMAGWPRTAAVGVTLLLMAAVLLPGIFRVRLAAVGVGLALVGVAVPLATIALGTTAAWPWVWGAVASRARIAFGENTASTREGQTVRGPGPATTLRFTDEQRVGFRGRGSVWIEPRDGAPFARRVGDGDEMTVHPGDQLVVAAGVRLRFEPGRRVPDAPDSGPAWVEPPKRDASWVALLGLGVTGVLGTLGLPAGVAPRGGRMSPARGAVLTAALVTLGVALMVGWGVYAAWLTPEIYAGGVAGAEVFLLPAGVPALGVSGSLLAWVALAGLAAGGAAAALAALPGPPGRRGESGGRGLRRRSGLLLVAAAGFLACLGPLDAWALLIAALGLAASALAPAAVLTFWSQRATPRGLAAGATLGFAAFALLTVVAARGLPEAPEGWATAALSAPAAIAAFAHLAAAWVLRGSPPPGRFVPPGLAGLAAPAPPEPQEG